MAIRYSGDVEVRMTYVRRGYDCIVRAPYRKFKVHLQRDEALNLQWFEKPLKDPKSPEAYDRVAKFAIMIAELAEGPLPIEMKRKDILIRRVFQSGCPARS